MLLTHDPGSMCALGQMVSRFHFSFPAPGTHLTEIITGAGVVG